MDIGLEKMNNKNQCQTKLWAGMNSLLDFCYVVARFFQNNSNKGLLNFCPLKLNLLI